MLIQKIIANGIEAYHAHVRKNKSMLTRNPFNKPILHSFKSVLEKPGQSDLSSHVNFQLLKEIASKKNLYVSPIKEQKHFLLELGIKERLNSLTKNVSSSVAEAIDSGVKRLIDPDKMGSLFKVIAITKTKRHLEGLN